MDWLASGLNQKGDTDSPRPNVTTLNTFPSPPQRCYPVIYVLNFKEVPDIFGAYAYP